MAKGCVTVAGIALALGIGYLFWAGIVTFAVWLLSLNGVQVHLNTWATAALCMLATAVISLIVKGWRNA